MTIKTFFLNPIRVCTYIVSEDTVSSDGIRRAVIIDGGCYSQEERQRLYDYITSNKLQLVAHLLTHGHLDHVFGAAYIFQQWGITPMLHPADEEYFTHIKEQADFFGIPFNDEQITEYLPISDNQTLDFGFATAQVIYTPGHTQGGVCYLFTDQTSKQTAIFSGDTVFQMGIGRCDLPGGNYPQLISSIENRLLTLDKTIDVFPGHGLQTKIGDLWIL